MVAPEAFLRHVAACGMRPTTANALRIRALGALRRQIGYPYREAKVLCTWGQLHASRGEPELARARFQEALAILTRLGERLYAGHIERALGDLATA